MPEPIETPQSRELDLVSLRALAHPLRVRLLDALSTYGSFTASGLAERLGESSGATSYHLRQLEKHGFVREVEGRGSARERWWERSPGTISIGHGEVLDTAAGRAASDIVLQQWQYSRDALLHDFLTHGVDRLPREWGEAATIMTGNVRLTVEQLAEVSRAWETFIEPIMRKYRGQNVPGSRPIQVQFNVFPVLDGDVTPEETP